MSDTQVASAAPSTSDAMSPAEAAYFQSFGSDTDAVVNEYAGQMELDIGKPAATVTEPAVEAPAADAVDAKATDDGETTGDEDIVVGPDGKARNAATGKFVPHAALHQERSKRKAVETENQTMRERLARAEERLATMNELLAPDKGEQKPEAKAKSVLEEDDIDPEQDIFAAFKQQQRRNAELLKRVTERETQEKAKESGNSLASAYKSDAQAFMAKTPDFKDAYVHLINGMHRELEAVGVADADARNALIAEKEKEFVQTALGSKKSPAEMLYKVAQSRGYSAKAAEVTVTERASDKLDSIRKGQSAVVSLSKSGGSSGEPLTIESLTAMSESEFSRVTAKLSKEQLRSIMGG